MIADSLTISAAEVREVLRCEHCHLRQFRTTNDHCRRCHRSYFPVVPPTLAAKPKAAPPAPISSASFRESVALILRALRNIRRYSQLELGKRMGVPRTYISKVERGDSLPTASTIVKFANALDLPTAVVVDAIERCAFGQSNSNTNSFEGETL